MQYVDGLIGGLLKWKPEVEPLLGALEEAVFLTRKEQVPPPAASPGAWTRLLAWAPSVLAACMLAYSHLHEPACLLSCCLHGVHLIAALLLLWVQLSAALLLF